MRGQSINNQKKKRIHPIFRYIPYPIPLYAWWNILFKGFKNHILKSSTPFPRAIDIICKVHTEEINRTVPVAILSVKDSYSCL